MSNVKKFFLHYTHFFLGLLSTLLFGFITFPILTRLLTEDQYGIMGLVTNTVAMAVTLAKAGLSDGIIRIYKEFSQTEEQRNIFSSTVIIRGLILSALVLLAYLVLFPALMPYLRINEKYLACFMIMSLYLFIRPLNIILLNLLRVNEKTVFFNVATNISKVASVGLSIFLLLYFVRGILGYFVGIIIGEYILTAILAGWFISQYKVQLSKVSGELSKRLIMFGAPLLLSETFYLLLSYFDRYLIIYFCDEKALGLYSVGYNLAMYIGNLITFSLNYAVIPIYVKVFEEAGKEKTEKFLSESINYLLIIIIPLCFAYVAVSRDLFTFLASVKYAGAAEFSWIILLGAIILGVISILNAGLYLKKKTSIIFSIMAVAVIANIGLNFILIPIYGIKGAAFASLSSSSLAAVLSIIFSFRYISIRLNIGNIIFYLVVSFCMYFVLSNVNVKMPLISLLLKSLIIIAILAPVIFYKEDKIRFMIKGFVFRKKSGSDA